MFSSSPQVTFCGLFLFCVTLFHNNAANTLPTGLRGRTTTNYEYVTMLSRIVARISQTDHCCFCYFILLIHSPFVH